MEFISNIIKALNYPVDLYYLMDLSNSMSDDRENVVKVIQKRNAKYQKYGCAPKYETNDILISSGESWRKQLRPLHLITK